MYLTTNEVRAMHTPSYLLKNSFGIYHLRLAVPKHLRHTVGKREIKKTLRTGNRREALRKARRLVTQYQDWFDQMADFDDILNNPLNKQLKFDSITTNPDGTVTATGVELDPDNIEADTAALQQLLNGTSTPHQPSTITLKELIDEYLEALKDDCNTKTLAGYTAHLTTFLEILGDVPIDTITRKRAREAVSILKQLPPNRNKVKPYRDLSIAAIIQMKPEKVMSVTTVRLYVERMTALFDFAIDEQLFTGSNPFTGLKPKKATRPDQERKQFTSADLAALFNPNHFQPQPGKPSQYWIPLIAAYTGMRLEEICQLRTQDIQHLNGIPCIDINNDGDKRLKNQSAARRIPIHSHLINQGFIDFASKQQGKLFPELVKANGKRGHHFSKWFARYRQQSGVTEPGKTFHSFRHTVATQFKRADIEETKAAAILGHTVKGETYGRYGKQYRPEQLRQVIEVIDYGNAVP